MSFANANRARLYLEQQVPELQEFVRKEIFTQDEVQKIAQKRSEFEHLINAPQGTTSTDYARYAEYEMNVDTLCKKRMKRLNMRPNNTKLFYTGSRQIFFILDRGTRRFPGDMRLWMQYLEYCRREQANRKVKEVLASCLRLHPTKPDLWVYAASTIYEDDGDMSGSRSYMHRGLRFCKSKKEMWLQYAKLEMLYIEKIAARRRILGLDGNSKRKRDKAEKENDEFLRLPQLTAEDIAPSLAKGVELDEVALRNLENTPALSGAIPLAIFDEAMKQFKEDEDLAREFFDMVSEFSLTPCNRKILEHITDHLSQKRPVSLDTLSCQIRLPLFGRDTRSPEFPAALGIALQAIREFGKRLPKHSPQSAERAIRHLLPYVAKADLDRDLQTVLEATIQGLLKSMDAEDAAKLLEDLAGREPVSEAKCFKRLALKNWVGNGRLEAIKPVKKSKKEK